MNLPFYDASLQMRETPNDHYRNSKQAEINKLWDNSTQTIYTVLEQGGIGSKFYAQKDISVDSSIDIGTGYKKSDDYKVFSYKDLSAKTPLGLMYQFDDNYWIAINTGAIASVVSTVEVRRCDNILRWIDKDNGRLLTAYCAIDYELSSPNVQKDKDVIVDNGHCLITIQYNDITKTIKKNQRFIIGGQPFKLSAINNLHYDNVDGLSNALVYLDLYMDIVEPDDDMENGIANSLEYVYSISFDNPITQQVSGFIGNCEATVLCNGNVMSNDITWTSNDYATINDDGTYTLTGEVGQDAVITATLTDNTSVSNSYTIQIVESVEDVYTIDINPIFNTIKEKESIVFTPALYKNGVKQQDEVSASINLSSKYATLTYDSTSKEYTLTYVKFTNSNLVLTLVSGETIRTINITLKPFF